MKKAVEGVRSLIQDLRRAMNTDNVSDSLEN